MELSKHMGTPKTDPTRTWDPIMYYYVQKNPPSCWKQLSSSHIAYHTIPNHTKLYFTVQQQRHHFKGPYMGGCQNYGPFLGPLNTRCRIICRTLKGTIILTTTHLDTVVFEPEPLNGPYMDPLGNQDILLQGLYKPFPLILNPPNPRICNKGEVLLLWGGGLVLGGRDWTAYMRISKKWGPSLEVLIIRIIVCWDLLWGPLFLETPI